MPLTQGLSPNIPLDDGSGARDLPPELSDILVEFASNNADDQPQFDDRGNVVKIEHGDGSVTVSLDGRPIESAEKKEDMGWFANLAEDIGDMDLQTIANDLIRDIELDIASRAEWIEDRAQAMKLLGLKLELPGVTGSSEGAPVEGMSRIRHPLLLEAVLRFQANARSELLPTDGPVKVRVDATGSTVEQDSLANALEKDLNTYLTVGAPEYYPDTDRMLLMLGFGGTAFKKIYFCPLRQRPVSETVDAEDLIVNESATDLRSAKRVTHVSYMKPSTLRRLQILGVYRDVPLGDPMPRKQNAAQEEKKSQQGLTTENSAPQDRDHEIYECYCELDIPGYEHKKRGKVTGLEVPYRVTIDTSSKTILSIVRNFDKCTEDLPEARSNFVKYTFVPGFGFLDIGLLHILGNTTNAITAAWRELLDAGMFSNFPGFLYADTGARQNTNMFRVPPGGGAPVKTGGMKIGDAILPLPYKEPSQALMALVSDMASTGMRIGGTSEQQVGEGRADAPVGTTLAMIEQAAKVLNAVHKRMHASQAEEFRLLVRTFREHPESFVGRCKKPTTTWTEETFIQALDDHELTPQADPNTASHSQRVMKVMGLKQLQAASPQLYDPIAIDRVALMAMGWGNPEQFFAPPQSQTQPSPEIMKGMAEIEIKKQDADTRATDAQTRAAAVAIKAKSDGLGGGMQQSPVDPLEAQKLQNEARAQENAANELQVRIEESRTDAATHASDNAAKIEIERLRAAHDARSDNSDYATEQLISAREWQSNEAALRIAKANARKNGK